MRASTSHRSIRALACLMLASGVSLLGCQSAQDTDKDWFDGGPMKPATAETMQLTVRVLAAKGQTAQAGFLLNRMLVEHPDHLGTYTEGAEVLLIEGRVDDAIAWLSRGLERMPGQPLLLNDRGVCHLLAANLDQAARDFDAAYAADPRDADFVSNVALARALQGRDEEALQLWNLVVSPEEAASNLRIASAARQKFASTASPGSVVIRR
ncbi:MAG: tetratricopeptide repeat protein [Phycisphaerales bacterium]